MLDEPTFTAPDVEHLAVQLRGNKAMNVPWRNPRLTTTRIRVVSGSKALITPTSDAHRLPALA